MLSLLLALTGPASASPLPPPEQALAASGRERGQETGKSSSGKSGGGSKDRPPKDERAPRSGGQDDEPRWEGSWYAEPTAGATIHGSGATAAGIGGVAGYRYKLVNTPLPTWSGQTRISASYSTNSSGLQGLDVRLGSFIGPSWKDLSLQAGPDLFWNQVLNARADTLEPSTGLEFPLSASYRLTPLTLSAGVSPAWLSNEARRVDWDTVDSALPGFGHEFTYRAGVGLNIEGFNVSVSYSYRIVRAGVQQGFSFGVRL